MLTRISIAALLAAVLVSTACGRSEGESKMSDKPLPRSKSFFGLHFDLHPSHWDTTLGADITEEGVAALLERIKPDYVQYDCKGHSGYTGYPTKIGTPSPGIVKDSLAIWRKVTREHGVALYIHYSGVWDNMAISNHPDWACVDAYGNPSPQYTSVFGPYRQEFMIPQMCEVFDMYDLDGAWVDGEAWAAQLDYSKWAMEAWKKETGCDDAPKSREDSRWQEWKMFHRRAFERHVKEWVDGVHKRRPNAQLTSNWMYTTFMPKEVEVDIDFLSGDYSPEMSVDRARCEARYLASTNTDWDLMAWGFMTPPGLSHNIKTPVHLMQEASVVLMQGGGFQIYYQPTRGGHIDETIIETAAQVGEFCRARQQVSHKSTSVPQIAVLLSTETQMDESDQVYNSGDGTLQDIEGALHALLELHYSVDILAEHQLQPRLDDFKLIVLPDTYKLTGDFKAALLKYVENGGSLLILSDRAAKLFEPALGVKYEGEPQHTWADIKTPQGPANVTGNWQNVSLNGAEAIGYRYWSRDFTKDGAVAATINNCGKGKIAAVYGNLGLVYFRGHQPSLRSFIGEMVERLFPDPAFEIDGPPVIDASLRRTRDGRLSLHLLNTANVPHGSTYGIIDFIPPIGPITVRMSVSQKPGDVKWMPDGGKLKWSWKDGILSVTIPSLRIHGVIVVDK